MHCFHFCAVIPKEVNLERHFKWIYLFLALVYFTEHTHYTTSAHKPLLFFFIFQLD